MPSPAKDCETPVERNGKLGRKYRSQGTPAVSVPNGDRETGALSADRLEQHFAKQAK